jgi:matrixin
LAEVLKVGRFSVVLCVVSLSLAGGAACYDSTWGEAKRAQQHAAAAWKPAEIGPGYSGGGADAGKRVLRIRVRPNERYLAQTIDTPKQVADLVEDANLVLGPALGLELQVDRVQPWTVDAEEPNAALSALSADDPGDDVDLVVGMIGALPRQTNSLHELGVSTLLGKHLVVRAASRLDERDAIERTFTELSEDDRARIARQHRRHRAVAVFLHELGHSLGAVHEVDAQSLMRPAYDPKMNGFSGAGIALMRIALDGRDRRAIAQGQLEVLRGAAADAWVVADRDQEIARLEATLVPVPGKNAGGPPPSPSGPSAPPELRAGDAELFLKGSELLRHGAVAGAYGATKPLFEKYPRVSAVQDLRCQLATLRYLERGALRAECAPSVLLSGMADGGP